MDSNFYNYILDRIYRIFKFSFDHFPDENGQTQSPPEKSPYFSMMLDADSRWINHHEVAVDGPVMHRDVEDPNKLHVYLLSYERHSLIAHFVISISAEDSPSSLRGQNE